MKYQFLVPFIFTVSLAACGGGGSNDNGAANTPVAPTVVTAVFVTPVVGSRNTFADTAIDNLNNTINRTIVATVTSTSADGSFVGSANDPSGNSITTGIVNHTFYPTSYVYNSVPQVTSETITLSPGNLVNCIYSPHGSGAPTSLTAGQSWTFTYTEACGSNAPISYTQSGTFVGTESVTVPAGTFLAYKFQSTITWTTATGVITTETITHWRNAATTDSKSIKELVTYTYAGTAPPPGSIVSFTEVLQSYQ